MAISFTRYIDIVSGVGAGATVARRDLIGRLYTTNNLLPPQSFIDFENINQVGAYFGTASDEYKRAQFYFGWISKNITSPDKISFARWVDTAVAPRIYGNVQTQLLATWTAISNGSLGLTIGATANTFTGLDFSSALSLADVADVIQTAINAKTGTQWTAATVTWNSTRGSFDFVGGDAVTAEISVQQGVGGTPIGNTLGWLSGTTLIVANGSAVESITDTLTNSAAASNDFGSFLFMPSLSQDEIVEAATWNQTQNIMFIYTVPVSASDASSLSDALIDIGGVCLTLSEESDEYPEQVPMMILAATNYDAVNSVQNYMFQQFNLTASVSTDSDADTYDSERVNYYGVTQTAGQYVAFYQRGLMMGLATYPSDMNVYANEIWLKDAIGADVMTLFMSVAKISANQQGMNQILAVIQNVINEALDNGTISVGKNLTTVQKLYVTQVTGDENAWYQVQNVGYWVNCVPEPYTTDDNRVEYKAVYTLVYSKDDTIRKVEGSNILI